MHSNAIIKSQKRQLVMALNHSNYRMSISASASRSWCGSNPDTALSSWVVKVLLGDADAKSPFWKACRTLVGHSPAYELFASATSSNIGHARLNCCCRTATRNSARETVPPLSASIVRINASIYSNTKMRARGVKLVHVFDIRSMRNVSHEAI